jgi:TRAP-type C4-dicarboxylate transport system permease small subunit
MALLAWASAGFVPGVAFAVYPLLTIPEGQSAWFIVALQWGAVGSALALVSVLQLVRALQQRPSDMLLSETAETLAARRIERQRWLLLSALSGVALVLVSGIAFS